MSSRLANCSETSGFYGVPRQPVSAVPVKSLCDSRARRITGHSGQMQVRVQSSLFSGEEDMLRWEMFILKALSGKPSSGTRQIRGWECFGTFEMLLCQFPARGARPELYSG
ncbi:hypothetical protein Enr10x_27030 [Gimesia panareensis]|uniref:Uncharacterized protein n=1 Tax=Gimesia panareensis TaxID=2527978 RepID=A0A517Q701_9PLAN|nr:hypothetical protein Enr10x_27030 [Gimesia panareensis]QDU49782.1 hypothetical protein Pan110_21210 [Gimesia panareensis]